MYRKTVVLFLKIASMVMRIVRNVMMMVIRMLIRMAKTCNVTSNLHILCIQSYSTVVVS